MGYTAVASPNNGPHTVKATPPFTQGARLQFGNGLRRSPQRVAAVHDGAPAPAPIEPTDAAYDEMQAVLDSVEEEMEGPLN